MCKKQMTLKKLKQKCENIKSKIELTLTDSLQIQFFEQRINKLEEEIQDIPI